MNNNNFVEAKYTQQKISEYIGNPLIEALPDILEDPVHIALALTKYPRYDLEDLSCLLYIEHIFIKFCSCTKKSVLKKVLNRLFCVSKFCIVNKKDGT